MAKKSQHVVPTEDGAWAVRSAGSSRATKKFRTQSEAIAVGRRIAKNQGSDLLIHRSDGRIREKDSYGKDPFPPRE
ncbi:MAG: DUF2188 domain-containing protein [Dehalococcoidia bacterium]